MARMVQIRCDHCNKRSERVAGEVNRARKAGLPLYCNRACSGLARRKHRTKAQLIEAKRLYDIEYRKRDPEGRKAARQAYHRATYDPVTAAEHRKKRMQWHVQYCQRPEYKEWKREYDKAYRAEKLYGPFAEAFMLLGDLEAEIASRMSKYEIYLANGTINKALKRRREHAALVSGRP